MEKLQLTDSYSMEVSLQHGGRDRRINEIIGHPPGKFTFSVATPDGQYKGTGIRGDDAIWLPCSNGKGFKIIAPNEYFSLAQLEENVRYIQSLNSAVFPEIFRIMSTDEYLVLEMEAVKDSNRTIISPQKWLPANDLAFINKHLQAPLDDLNACTREFAKHQLCPEDEWYKPGNLISGKVVDFHCFVKMPERYLLPNNLSKEESAVIYSNAVARYKARGDNKWKGKIYQGMRFANGHVMQGYTSDKIEFDSYRKLQFSPLCKAKEGKVFDFGCNEGFFSIQSALHGCKHVRGYDITPEDVQLAREIIEMTGTQEAVKLANGDAIEALDKSDNLSVLIMHSVLHQIYKNMVGADSLLAKVASKTKYFAYETPVNHPTMTISLEDIFHNLKKHFKIVRLLYVYDAYSSGYRAVFACYTFS